MHRGYYCDEAKSSMHIGKRLLDVGSKMLALDFIQSTYLDMTAQLALALSLIHILTLPTSDLV